MNTKETKLRFAALRRVSTEQQEKTGESLRTQTAQLEKYIEELGGTFVGWYGGQESATPGHEKKELARLLQDAQRKTFDAVICTDADRWSRDNAASQAGLEVLRDAGIKFFTGGIEHNLFDPSTVMVLSIHAAIGQFFAGNQMKKSLLNRINRAKRGIPTGGKLPYGRIYVWDDSKTRQSGHWEIDPEKQNLISDCAVRYLTGESIEDLAKEYQMNAANLHKVLTKVSGPKWELEFTVKALKIHEVIPVEIPALLDQDTINAIHKRAKLNRTYQHGKIVHEYLFSGMISCAHCGYAMFGQANLQKNLYYRHLHSERDRVCPGPKRKSWIPAPVIEDAVMRHLFECFGNAAAVQRAIKDATPNNEGIQEALKRLEYITKEVEKLKASRKRILDWSVKGTISDEDATIKLEELKEREQKLNEERTRLDNELAHVPTRERIQTVSKMIAGQFRQYASAKVWAKSKHANEAFEEMTYAEKRQLCQMVFSGETAEGKRMGVWITWDQTGKRWSYRIEGHLIDATGPLKKEWFDFGSPHLQKQLVAESALR